jgi:peptidoglycan/xylan/chitin deacetylase (PgdA/CDA1 family)
LIKTFLPLFKDDEILNSFLLESNFNLSFTAKKKFYYSVVRPIFPIKLRQKLQEKVNSKVKLKENFISTDLIEYLEADLDYNSRVSALYPESYKAAIVITHDVEEQEGFDFIPSVIELEEKYGIKSSWNLVPYKYKIDEGIIKLIQENGDEIGIHGYNHDGKLYYSEKTFNERAVYINEALKKYNAIGFRSPQVHRNLEWLQRLNIKYDASCFDYDPFQPFPGGTGCIWPFFAGKFLELPYTIPQDHTLFYVLRKKNIEIWQKKVDWLLENNGMILSITHPDYLIPKSNFEMYEELLKYLKTIKNAWFCLPSEITKWYFEQFSQH